MATPITYPSVIPDMPDADYRAVDAVSSTHLKTCWRYCPATAKAQLDGLLDDDDKTELVTGIAVHAAILQPAHFDAAYAVGPAVDLRTSAGKATWADFQAAHPGAICLRAEPGAIVAGIRESLWSHPEASELLRRAEDKELSLFWIDPDTGLRCKARVDMLCRGIAYMPDLKTCQSAKPEKFLYHAWDYGYHIQLDHYWKGCAANGIAVEDAPIIACEKSPPYVVSVLNPTPKFMEEGSRLRDETLAIIAACRKSGEWPGYRKGISELMTPDEAYQAKRDARRME